MDKRAKGQSAKSEMEIRVISATALRQFYGTGSMTSIRRWDEVDNEIQLKAVNIRTKLAIRTKMNNNDHDRIDRVP